MVASSGFLGNGSSRIVATQEADQTSETTGCGFCCLGDRQVSYNLVTAVVQWLSWLPNGAMVKSPSMMLLMIWDPGSLDSKRVNENVMRSHNDQRDIATLLTVTPLI